MSELENQDGALVSELADDPDLVELVELFVSELPDRIASIGRACTEQDLDALASLAHQLRGAAGGYGFPSITEVAGTLEQRARTEDSLDALNQTVQELSGLCRRARAK